MKYRRKPRVDTVEAIEWDGSEERLEQIKALKSPKITVAGPPVGGPFIRVLTRFGTERLENGDFLVRDDATGEVFIYSGDEFIERYESAA